MNMAIVVPFVKKMTENLKSEVDHMNFSKPESLNDIIQGVFVTRLSLEYSYTNGYKCIACEPRDTSLDYVT
jgi:hypothetical protein